MKTSKWCNLNLNSSEIKSIHINGEIKELVEARTMKEIKEELSDVLYFTYCYIQKKFNINLPMYGAMKTVNKVIERLQVWEGIFNDNDLLFNKKYLVNGSNHMRKDKVAKALSLAKADQLK